MSYPRMLIILTILAGLAPVLPGTEHIYDTEPTDAIREGAETLITDTWKELLAAAPEVYVEQVRPDAMACTLPQTYDAYGFTADEGFTIDPGSIVAEISDVVVDPQYVDLRKITVSTDGREHDTGLWGVFVHYKYTCSFTWTATKGDETRSYRSEKPHRMETHHQLFPVAAVKHVFELEAFKDKQTLLINGDLFRRPPGE